MMGSEMRQDSAKYGSAELSFGESQEAVGKVGFSAIGELHRRRTAGSLRE